MIVILSLLVIAFPFLLNFKKVLGIGQYNVNYQEEMEFDDGQLLLDFNLDVNYEERIYNPEYRRSNYFYIITKIDLSRQGEVEDAAIEWLNYSIFLNDEDHVFEEESLTFDDAKSFRNTILRQLVKEDLVIFTGELGFSYSLNGESQEETLAFELTFRLPVDPGEYVYSVDLPLIWLTLLYFIVLGIAIIALSKVIWNIRFSKIYTDEMKEKDEYYHGYIKKLAEEKKAENSS
ncbi:MAG: hypothetical protein BAJALOKI2v1_570018 [Promethearchaeota archaeon]|nr:MAG: hypothetical protein BAJALOKI2v1_570018 [Candidatus Lokiarchaeota archaeon]